MVGLTLGAGKKTVTAWVRAGTTKINRRGGLVNELEQMAKHGHRPNFSKTEISGKGKNACARNNKAKANSPETESKI